MTVTIQTSELLFDIRNKSHLEVASIENLDRRYAAEAGTEKTEEILRCIIEAEARIRLMCERFLEKVTEGEAISDLPSIVPESYTYQFVSNARRQDCRAEITANTIHSAIVNLALSTFYVSVSQMEMAKTHDALATSRVQLLEKMLFEKLPPVLPQY